MIESTTLADLGPAIAPIHGTVNKLFFAMFVTLICAAAINRWIDNDQDFRKPNEDTYRPVDDRDGDKPTRTSTPTKNNNAARAARAAARREWESLVGRWNEAEARFAQLQSDPETLLTMPNILDVTVTATAKHITKRAHAARVAAAPMPTDAHQRAHAMAVITEALDAFTVAVAEAKRIGLGVLSTDDKRRLRQAIALLKRASNPVNAHELAADIAAVRRILHKMMPNLAAATDTALKAKHTDIAVTHQLELPAP